MLRILKTGTGDAPVLVCDYCNQRIENIRMALYTWKERNTYRWDENNPPEFVIPPHHPSTLADDGTIYTVHKACIDDFEEAYGGDTYHWPCLELIDLFVFLIRNGGMTAANVQEREASRREYGI